MPSRTTMCLLVVLAGSTAGALVIWGPSLMADAAVTPATNSLPQSQPLQDWVAAGPGRIEPVSGEIRIAASASGRIENLLVRPRDKVSKGALLAVIDDSEQRARVKAAEAEVSFREAERDTAISSSVPNERRSAEDGAAHAERELRRLQAAIDDLASAGASTEEIDAAQSRLEKSAIQMAESQRALDALTAGDGPRPSRTESALAVARAELGIAHAVLEKTRVRALRNGTILQVLKSPGDMASAADGDVLVTMGDIDQLRVRIEIDESDIGNISIGQRAVIRCDAFASKGFIGTVSLIAASARARTLNAQDASGTAKDNALEIIVDLEASAPLVPGMRVDAFFETTNLADTRGGANGH